MRRTCMHYREAYVARYMYRWITVIARVVTVEVLYLWSLDIFLCIRNVDNIQLFYE